MLGQIDLQLFFLVDVCNFSQECYGEWGAMRKAFSEWEGTRSVNPRLFTVQQHNLQRGSSALLLTHKVYESLAILDECIRHFLHAKDYR